MFVTLEEAKGYLRVDSSDEDELILRLMETSDRLILDVTRQTPEELKEYGSVVRTAELYVIAYLYEHREEADHNGNIEVSVFWNQEGDILMIELMRERITIQKSRTKTDKAGNHTVVWENHYQCFSYVNSLSGKEYWEAKQVNAETELDFVIRYCSEVSGLDTEHFRIVFRGNLYNISFIDNVQYKNKTVKIRAALTKR